MQAVLVNIYLFLFKIEWAIRSLYVIDNRFSRPHKDGEVKLLYISAIEVFLNKSFCKFNKKLLLTVIEPVTH